MMVSRLRVLSALLLLLWPVSRAVGQALPSIDAGTIVLRDVTFADGAGKIDTVELTAVTREGGKARARAVKIANLTFSNAFLTVDAPSMILSDVEGQSSIMDAVSGGRLSGIDWAQILTSAKLARLDIPTLTYSIKTDMMEQTVTSNGILLENLADGILSSATVGSQEGSSRTRIGDQQTSTSTRAGTSRSERIDVAEFARVFSGGGRGPAKELTRQSTVQGLETQDGQSASRIGSMSAAGLFGRGPTVAIPYHDMLRIIAGEMKVDAALRSKLIAAVREMVTYFRLDSAGATDIEFKSPDATVAIAAMNFQGMRFGSLDLFRLSNIEGTAGQSRFALGGFSIEGLNYDKLVDQGFAALEASGENAAFQPTLQALPRLKAIRIENLDAMSAPEPIAFDSLSLETVQPGDFPQSIGLYLKRLKMQLDQGIPNEGKDRLLALGYTQMVADAQAIMRYDADARALIIEKTGAAVDEAGGIFTTVRLGGFDPELLAGGSEPFALTGKLTLDAVDIDITDTGLAERFYASIAKDAGVSVDAIREGLAAELRSQAQALLGDALAPGAAEALGTFLRQPGKLAIHLAPRPGAPPLSLAELQGDSPPLLADRVTIRMEAGAN